MADLALLLGAAVVKIACKIWLKDQSVAADATINLVDIIQAHASKSRDQRRLRRMFEGLEERVADNVLNSLDIEFGTLPHNDREAAVLAVADSFDKVALTNRDLFAADLDASRLFRSIKPLGKRFTDDLSAGATELYDRILRDCCAHIVEVANALPGFEVGVFAEILAREKEIVRHLDHRFDRLPMQLGGAGARAFEPMYLRLVAKQLDKVELFGVPLSDRISTYPLSVAYVSLSIRVMTSLLPSGALYEQLAEMQPERRFTSIENALSTTKRAFIRGEAGSGKTTLLQWLAVRCGHRDFDGLLRDWNGCVPLFIRLRRYAGIELPRPEEFLREVGGSIAHVMPLDWMHTLLHSGRALVLVDGVDELPEWQRRRAREWLRELIAAYPDAKYVITSRPTAAGESWLTDEAFGVLEIQPMTVPDIQAFVTHWHAAFAEALTNATEIERIETSRRELIQSIRTNRHLRMLTVNPLMTALICALHLERRMQLPHDRMELYSIALDMLLERRDTERQIDTSDITIARIDKTLILQDLAYWLVRNGRSTCSTERAVERLTAKLMELHRVDAKADEVLRHLLDRSGLLRTPVEGQIDFVHKTFQEFLAGRAAVAADDIGVLINNAHDDQWREVILMAVAHARPQQTGELLRGILSRADKEKDSRYVLRVLAVGSIQHAPELSPELQEELKEVARELLPPKRMTQAAALAGAGDLVLELLSDRTEFTVREAPATVRMAAAIGGDLAMSIIAVCAKRSHPSVREELDHAWTKFEPEEFAQQVLATSPFATSARVEDASLLPALKHLPIRTLRCGFPHGYGDVDYVGDLPHLESFGLHDIALSSIQPLATHDALQWLSLAEGTRPVDIGPLGACPSLEKVEIAYSSIANYKKLNEIAQISSLQFIGGAPVPIVLANLSKDLRLRHFGVTMAGSIVRGLEDLIIAPQLSQLDSLSLGKADNIKTIAGIDRWATSLTTLVLNAPELTDVERVTILEHLTSADLRNTPIESLEVLGNLPRLSRLDIGGFRAPIPDLTPLKELAALQHLYLWTDQTVDVSGLANAANLKVTICSSARVALHGEEALPMSVEVRHSVRNVSE